MKMSDLNNLNLENIGSWPAPVKIAAVISGCLRKLPSERVRWGIEAPVNASAMAAVCAWVRTSTACEDQR